MKPRIGSWSGFKKKPSIGDKYLTWHVCVLLGYALLGRTFAYLGFAPAYIGEITLLFGLLAWLLNRYALKVFELLTAWFLVGFVLWSCMRTLPYLSKYGVEALRDAAAWGYCFFAFIIATLLIAKPERLRVLIDRYRWFCILFAAIMPVVMLIFLLGGEALPRLPGTTITIFEFKPNTVLVHLGGIVAFILSGLGTVPLFVTAMVFVIFPIAAASRGGILAFFASVSLVAFLRPLSAKLWRALAISVFGIVILSVAGSGLSIQFPDGSREVSVNQVVSNLQSVYTDQGTGNVQGTKQWRINWWNKIIDYTFDGPYFWTGKGYGINLANDDGFQVREDRSLRSPHNGHLTMLARSGVPGLSLWLLVQLGWVLGMLVGYRRSRLKGERRWAGLFLFLLAYWAAFMVDAAFDVALEGPMVGVWFWTIYGVGLAAMWIYKYHPETLVGYQRPYPLVHSPYRQPSSEDVLSVSRSDTTLKHRTRDDEARPIL